MANIRQAAVRSLEQYKRASELKALPEQSTYPSLDCNGLTAVFPAGLRRGCIAEVSGPRSSGRMSLALRILAEATGQGEVVAVVDLHNHFSPLAAGNTGLRLEQLVWIQCGGNAEHAMRACDLLLHAGGFGVVALDLCEATPRLLNRIPVSYWYRFRRALEDTSTVLLLLSDSPQAKSTAYHKLQTKTKAFHWSGERPFSALRGVEFCAVAGKISSIRPSSLFLQAVV